MLQQSLRNYNPFPIFINKVLLEQSYIHSFAYNWSSTIVIPS